MSGRLFVGPADVPLFVSRWAVWLLRTALPLSLVEKFLSEPSFLVLGGTHLGVGLLAGSRGDTPRDSSRGGARASQFPHVLASASCLVSMRAGLVALKRSLAAVSMRVSDDSRC